MACGKDLNSRHLFRFIVVGLLNTGVDFTIFTLLNSIFAVNYLYSQLASYVAGLLNSFFLNKMWTFNDKRADKKSILQFISFLFINLCSAGSMIGGLKVLIDYFGISLYYSKVLVTGISMVINYFGYKFWVFKSVYEKTRII